MVLVTTTWDGTTSPAVRGRGLKQRHRALAELVLYVARRTRAWIETAQPDGEHLVLAVARRTRAWIETAVVREAWES